jgi:hypothetical protein
MKTPGNDELKGNENVEVTNRKSIDKFLVAIVIGAILLVIIVFIVILTKPKPDYLPENSPEGVAHNYLFALEKGDYSRAYSYLSPKIEGYPEDTDDFIKGIEDYSFRFNQDRVTSQQIESVQSGEKTAIITIKETTFSEGGIFERSEYTSSFDMNLDLENGDWKITESDRYFAFCWQFEDGCP